MLPFLRLVIELHMVQIVKYLDNGAGAAATGKGEAAVGSGCTASQGGGGLGTFLFLGFVCQGLQVRQPDRRSGDRSV